MGAAPRPPAPAGASRLRVGWRIARAGSHVLLGALITALVFPWLGQRRRLPWVRWWARGFLAALGLRVRQRGEWPAAAGRYLLTSNHISWLDIFVIHAIHPVRFVSKSEVRRWPLAGWLAAEAGTLFVDRARKRDTHDIGRQIHDVLAAGDAVGIFPEGTTSDGTVLLPFFSPLLQPAVRCHAALVPTGLRYLRRDGSINTELAYIGDQTFGDSLRITLRQPPSEVEVRFGAPMSCAGLHRRELAQHAEEAVAALLEVAVDHHWQAPGSNAAADGATPLHARSRRARAAAAAHAAAEQESTSKGADQEQAGA